MIEDTSEKQEYTLSVLPKLGRSSGPLIYLAVLVTLYTIYLSKTIMLPVVIAIFISFLAAPLLKVSDRKNIPRSVSSLFIVLGLVILFGALSFVFTAPAQHWWTKFPQLIQDVHSSINEIGNDLTGETSTGIATAAEANGGAIPPSESNLDDATMFELVKGLLVTTPTIITQILTVVFLTYFFLAYGKALFIKVIHLLPSFSDKKQAAVIVHDIREKLSKYVLTITLINTGLGMVVGIALYILGIPDAFFWGMVAGVLNFAPYVGPIVSALVYFVISYLHFEDYGMAILTPSVYLCINLLECQAVTPMLLGRTLKLNPLIVFIWLILWGWLWGVFGMLIAVPLLVCVLSVLENTQMGGKWYELATDEQA